MSTLRVRSVTDQAGWDDFVRRVGAADAFLQSWRWGEFQLAAGRPIQRLEVVDGDRRVAACLLTSHVTRLGKSFLMSPRGPLLDQSLSSGDRAQVWSQLVTAIAAQRPSGTMFLKIEPNVVPPTDLDFSPGTGTHPETSLVLDLRQGAEVLLEQMHPKTRYNITLAKRKGVVVRWTRDAGDVDIFLQLLAQTAKRQSIGIHPQRYYRQMIESLRDMVEVAIADHDGQPLAAGLMIRFGQVMTYLHGASDHSQRELMAPYAMHWETMARARADGFLTYDFFGIAPADSINHKWAGITRFKKGFGGQTVTYPGGFNLVYDRTWYTAYRLAKRMAGL